MRDGPQGRRPGTGHCLDCGEGPDLRRLKGGPGATLCTACQAIHGMSAYPSCGK
ncbi:TraR/DksA C4-type zinc finger protein [Polaromonas sp.]|uniref:TraR/DksA C4-type zinc finger protein n=1 Tax=Polaromonas sp. TaxID=1869339 RepID=UPI003457ED12